jgi:hypothetical protein
MPMNFDDVEAFLKGLPGVTIGAKWGNKTWIVNDKGFAWQRPLSKADLARYGDETPPKGEILAVRVESLDAKDGLLEMALPGFFTIPHFNGYAAVLIELRKAKAKDVRATLLHGFHAMAAKPARKKAARTSRRSR